MPSLFGGLERVTTTRYNKIKVTHRAVRGRSPVTMEGLALDHVSSTLLRKKYRFSLK